MPKDSATGSIPPGYQESRTYGFPRFRPVLFVNGCFWHGHNCHFFRLSGTCREVREPKIVRNSSGDSVVRARLHDDDWRRVVIWECALRGPGRMNLKALMHGFHSGSPETPRH